MGRICGPGEEGNLMEEIGAYAVQCPACMAPEGERCTAPTDTSRRPVDWVHYARETEALKASER